MIDKFKLYLLKVEALSDKTVDDYIYDITVFSRFLAAKRIRLIEASSKQVDEYFEGLSVSNSFYRRKVTSLKRFYRYLLSHGFIDVSPMSSIKMPKKIQTQHSYYSIELIARLLNAPDISKPLGVRDRLVLELLYGAGIRVGELNGLKVYDVDISERLLKVLGKGNKQRIVPFPKPVTELLESYLQIRLLFLKKNFEYADRLLLNKNGNPLNQRTVWTLVKKYAVKVGLEETFTTHNLRHAYASHLIEYGSDLYMVQSLLGHSDIDTTQIYTQIRSSRLKNLHKTHHPRA